MTNESTINLNELYSESNEATYCPEDDKIRLYVGRVPREEYLMLRKSGFVSTMKQDCDFVAVWTVNRENIALAYAGYIGDEDQGPEDRAADRAERFSMYRDKRRNEAGELADRYDSQSAVHGYQSAEKAERSAKRHDKIADHAVTQWSKAEYWQSRTAGVISNALYKSTPGVRMGRIKKLEAEQRRIEKEGKQFVLKQQSTFKIWQSIAGLREMLIMPIGWQYTAMNWNIESEDLSIDEMKMIACLSVLDDRDIKQKVFEKKLQPEKLALEWLEGKEKPADYIPAGRYYDHIMLRLAYENQMIEAVGGRAGDVQMKVGGVFKGFTIHKVNKSPSTKRVVSITILGEKTGYSYLDIAGTEFSWSKLKVERLSPDGYQEPTPEKIQEVKDFAKMLRAKAPKKTPLISPDMKSALKLQKIWNEEANKKYLSTSADAEKNSNEPIEMIQKGYSVRSKGGYSPCKTIYIGADGLPTYKQYYGNTEEGAICKIRKMSSGGDRLYSADRVVVISDKPQKSFPKFKAVEVTT